jgi:hypothetical protein
MALKTYHGSCHCGEIRYEADMDLAQGAGRCNCTYCLKTRAWSAFVKPDAFRVTAGEDRAVSYHKHELAPEKFHCSTCGVHLYGRGDADYMRGPFVSVCVATLDDATPEELAAMPVRYSDGLNNNWQNPPAITSYL